MQNAVTFVDTTKYYTDSITYNDVLAIYKSHNFMETIIFVHEYTHKTVINNTEIKSDFTHLDQIVCAFHESVTDHPEV